MLCFRVCVCGVLLQKSPEAGLLSVWLYPAALVCLGLHILPVSSFELINN